MNLKFGGVPVENAMIEILGSESTPYKAIADVYLDPSAPLNKLELLVFIMENYEDLDKLVKRTHALWVEDNTNNARQLH